MRKNISVVYIIMLCIVYLFQVDGSDELDFQSGLIIICEVKIVNYFEVDVIVF